MKWPRTPYLPKTRQAEIAIAFAAWYKSVPRLQRGAKIRRGGKEPKMANHYVTGKATPPPTVLAVAYQETNNPVFLYTADEKKRLREARPDEIIPNTEIWPDKPEVGQKSSPAVGETNLIADINRLIANIDRLGRLPSESKEREKARKELVGPAMRLFTVATRLGLEFPDEFADLLSQLQTAESLFKT